MYKDYTSYDAKDTGTLFWRGLQIEVFPTLCMLAISLALIAIIIKSSDYKKFSPTPVHALCFGDYRK